MKDELGASGEGDSTFFAFQFVSFLLTLRSRQNVARPNVVSVTNFVVAKRFETVENFEWQQSEALAFDDVGANFS